MKIILLIILCIFIYAVGNDAGERETIKRIKKYIKESKDWNEIMEKFSVDWNKYNIGE